MHIKLTFIGLLIFLGLGLGHSQGIYSEDDISAQDLLISAKKQIILGNTDEAIEIYNKLLKEHSEPVAAYELSRIYFQKEDVENALLYSKKAYDSESDNKWYLVQYAELLSHNNNYKRAAEVFESYLSAEPNNEYYYMQASFQYLKAEMPKDAIKVLEKLEKNKGVSESVSQRKFEIYDVLGKEKEALSELKKLSAEHPDETRYLHNIAGYLRSMGKEGEANKVIKRILEIDPNDETAILIASSSGKNKDANYLRSLVPIIKDSRIDFDKKVVELIPYLEDFANNNDEELGQSLIDVTLIMDEYYPKNAKVKSILGDIFFYQKKWPEATENYKASIDIDKSIWPVWQQLFLSLNIDENYELLEEVSEDAIEVYPNQALAYLYNGLALLEIGNITEAEMSIQEAGMIAAGNPQILSEVAFLMSKVKLYTKAYEEALQFINESLNLEEMNPRFLEQLGDVKLEMNDAEGAKSAWKKALKAGGNPDKLKKKINGEASLNN